MAIYAHIMLCIAILEYIWPYLSWYGKFFYEDMYGYLKKLYMVISGYIWQYQKIFSRADVWSKSKKSMKWSMGPTKTFKVKVLQEFHSKQTSNVITVIWGRPRAHLLYAKTPGEKDKLNGRCCSVKNERTRLEPCRRISEKYTPIQSKSGIFSECARILVRRNSERADCCFRAFIDRAKQ